MNILCWIMIILFSCNIFACSCPPPPVEDIGTELAYMHILNTGWEDAIILESEGRYALVDAGEPGRGPYIVNYLQRLAGSDKVHLDFVIATHSHIDHIGGFPYVINHPDITIGRAYLKREANRNPDGTYGGRRYQEFLAACESNGIPVVLDGLDALELSFGHMAITLLNGRPLAGGSTNPESLCQLVEVGGLKALLAADMVSEANERYVYQQIGGMVDLLKVGHHGLSDSTGTCFARNLRPAVVIYTNGSSWAVESHDVTLGEAKGLSGYYALKAVGAIQYVTTDNGGILAVFGEHGIEYRAIQEFSRRGDTLDFELRGDISLRPITEPNTLINRLLNWLLQPC